MNDGKVFQSVTHPQARGWRALLRRIWWFFVPPQPHDESVETIEIDLSQTSRKGLRL